ncbi:nuclear transport factor 2 family protein [Halococcus hamelinensis]|uniref:SnoaL-like domain-containing protein n=1 Tax=Halococcus hamelinensis 100A6 TaxID=1132509 RepID=M0M0H4_9EURY|nr:nuclear transport factor 2 family protein [Halococcus hamelinensis]EMA39176.1 hypothetical protein C447_06658 [Halococcus hamelinensis 100A6]
MSTTEDVLDHHLEAFGDQDIEATMADYADDAVVITHGEVYRGREAIGDWFETELFTEFEKPDVTFTLNEKTVEGEYAYITWEADTPETDYEFATDTFVVRDGKIVAQTLGVQATSKH